MHMEARENLVSGVGAAFVCFCSIWSVADVAYLASLPACFYGNSIFSGPLLFLLTETCSPEPCLTQALPMGQQGLTCRLLPTSWAASSCIIYFRRSCAQKTNDAPGARAEQSRVGPGPVGSVSHSAVEQCERST